MPIEIKELIIRTTVDTAEAKPTGRSQPSPRVESVLEGIKELSRQVRNKNER